MAVRRRISSLGVLLALGAGSLSPLTAGAATIATTPVIYSFSNSASVTDGEAAGSTSNNNASLGSSAIAQFDSSFGVLTGVKLNLTSTRTQTVTVNADSGRETGNNYSRTSSGSGQSSAALTGPGVDGTFETISHSGSCTGGRLVGCSSSTTASPSVTDGAVPIAVAQLDAYVGSQFVEITRAAPVLQAAHAESNFKGEESTTYSLTWAGELGVTYEYFLHALPSFSAGSQVLTLSHNFGTLTLDQAASPWSFDIFNLEGLDRVGLDLDSIVGDGHFERFALSGLSSFAGGLAAGAGSDYWIDFDTSVAGEFSATYYFNLSDADVGAASSRYDYPLALHLLGTVTPPVVRQAEPRNNVPEPATLALFTLGIAALPLVRRRRTPA